MRRYDRPPDVSLCAQTATDRVLQIAPNSWHARQVTQQVIMGRSMHRGTTPFHVLVSGCNPVTDVECLNLNRLDAQVLVENGVSISQSFLVVHLIFDSFPAL